MAIKIVKGIYGYRNSQGIIQPKTPKDEPFSLTKEQEERLVEKGVAVYVNQEDGREKEQEEEQGNLDAEDLESMSYNELKRLAKNIGIPADGKKEELIKRIAETEVSTGREPQEETEGEENGEEPPELKPEEPK